LKSRLLKPSIILPMGHYLAGSHHLKILAKTFTKINMDFDKKILIIKINRTFILSHVLLVHLFLKCLRKCLMPKAHLDTYKIYEVLLMPF